MPSTPVASEQKAFTLGSVPWLRKRPGVVAPSAIASPPAVPMAAGATSTSSSSSSSQKVPLGGEGLRHFAVEICCGAAGVTAELAQVGFDAVGVDYHKNKHKPIGKIIKIDLTLKSGVELLWKLLADPRLAYVHMGPPCGTAARSRDIPLPFYLKGKYPEPKPLRSAEFPRGFEDGRLSARDAIRVAEANRIYDLCVQVAIECTRRGIPWTIENPKNSWFWVIAEVAGLLGLPGVGDVLFSACMHGSRRDKKGRLRCYPLEKFISLAILCNNSHSFRHEPWRIGPVFQTSLECEYPQLFCARLAECARVAAGIVKDVAGAKSRRVELAAERAAAGRQARGDPLPPLVSEFKAHLEFECPPEMVAKAQAMRGIWLKTPLSLVGGFAPVDSKIVQVNLVEKVGCSGPAVLPGRALLADIPHLGAAHVYIGRALTRGPSC